MIKSGGNKNRFKKKNVFYKHSVKIRYLRIYIPEVGTDYDTSYASTHFLQGQL